MTCMSRWRCRCIVSVSDPDRNKHDAHVSKPRRGVPHPLFDFYSLAGEDLPCLIDIRRL